eukprot:1151300-Pelagomonas_calceolata.AAC.1
MYANRLVTTRRALENKNTSRSQSLWWRGLTALLSQCVSFSLIDVGRGSSAYAVLLATFQNPTSDRGQGTCGSLSEFVSFSCSETGGVCLRHVSTSFLAQETKKWGIGLSMSYGRDSKKLGPES